MTAASGPLREDVGSHFGERRQLTVMFCQSTATVLLPPLAGGLASSSIAVGVKFGMSGSWPPKFDLAASALFVRLAYPAKKLVGPVGSRPSSSTSKLDGTV